MLFCMKTFFTSDLHFGHANVIKYSRRPFDDVGAMDATLINNWNAAVDTGDRVYILGDLSFLPQAMLVYYLGEMNGRKVLVYGNHDKRLRKTPTVLQLLDDAADLMTAKVADSDATDGVQRIVLCHYPMLVWDQSHRGAWHLHGHCHGTLPDDPNALRLDVGVDCWHYRPVEYAEIKARMKLKTWQPRDHHDGVRD